ncbi:MAG: TolB family protein [Marinilabiliaceae bacterium]
MTRKAACAAALIILIAGCAERPHDARQTGTLPEIWPDYAGVTIPKSIAPLCFGMADDEATQIEATVTAPDGTIISANGREADFDIGEWRNVLSHCTGDDSLMVSVAAKYAGGWRAYEPFTIYVSDDTLTSQGLTYRLIRPGYEVYSKMGIYWRDLTSFREEAIMENTEVPNSCVNCHTQRRGAEADFLFHVRGKDGGTLLSRGGKVEILNTPTSRTIGALTYPAWHPGGRVIAFSANTTRQSFHQGSDKRLEVFDVASDIVAYDTEENKLIASHLLNQTDSCWETFPCFSADGRDLYYCAARPAAMPSEVRGVRYGLMRIGFDADKLAWGEKTDTVLAMDSLSISLPRTSPDGRFVMFTACDYGTFPIWHKEAYLWLLDLATGQARPLDEVNSGEAESFHEWSSDSRWVVFASRRGDGLFTRLYLTHVGEDGRATKPFLLPQRSPKEYYRELMMSYNVPGFADVRPELDAKSAARRLMDGGRKQVEAGE